MQMKSNDKGILEKYLNKGHLAAAAKNNK